VLETGVTRLGLVQLLKKLFTQRGVSLAILLVRPHLVYYRTLVHFLFIHSV
jgi:hypothetical protein